jgi:hypothetical protein
MNSENTRGILLITWNGRLLSRRSKNPDWLKYGVLEKGEKMRILFVTKN